MNIKKYLGKEYRKFRKKSWLGKGGDILFILLIVLVLIPSTRKELMTLASKVRMHITSVEKEKTGRSLQGMNSVLLQDSSGEQHTLNKFLGKPVFVNFWATWCPPCRAEMPAIQDLYDKYGDEVHFLIVSDQDMATQQTFLDKKDYQLPVYELVSRPAGEFSYSVLPTSLLISPDKRIVLRKEGAYNWNSSKANELFQELIE